LLAKRTGTQPAAMRRLLTMDAPNPTLATVMSIVRSLGYSLALVPAQGRSKRGRTRKPAGIPLLRYDTSWDSVSTLGTKGFHLYTSRRWPILITRTTSRRSSMVYRMR
jgi:hypothetical protein